MDSLKFPFPSTARPLRAHDPPPSPSSFPEVSQNTNVLVNDRCHPPLATLFLRNKTQSPEKLLLWTALFPIRRFDAVTLSRRTAPPSSFLLRRSGQLRCLAALSQFCTCGGITPSGCSLMRHSLFLLPSAIFRWSPRLPGMLDGYFLPHTPGPELRADTPLSGINSFSYSLSPFFLPMMRCSLRLQSPSVFLLSRRFFSRKIMVRVLCHAKLTPLSTPPLGHRQSHGQRMVPFGFFPPGSPLAVLSW